MKSTLRKIIALVMTVALVATTFTFTTGGLKAEGEPEPAPAASEPAEPTPPPAPAVEKQEVAIESPAPAESAEPNDSVSEDSDSEAVSEEPAAPEAAEEELTEEEEEEEMPAQNFSQTASNGITVRVSAPEGAFPADTTMRVAAVSREKAMGLVEGSVENAEDANGVDITFFNKAGKEIQPKKPISVTLGNAKVDGDNFGVYHVSDGGDVDKVAGANANGGSFKSDEFSIYVVIGQEDEEKEVPDALTVNVRFISSDGAELRAPDTVIVEKKNEEGNKYLVEYTIPEISGKTASSVSGEGGDFELNENKTKVTASVNVDTTEPAEGETKTPQTASCDITFNSGEADYAIKYLFEKADAEGEYAEDAELSAGFPTTGHGEVGTITNVTAPEVNGFEADEDFEQAEILADGSAAVEIRYDRNEYDVIYNTNGGSYIKSKTVKYGSEVQILEGTPAAPEKKELTCTKEVHTHGDGNCDIRDTEVKDYDNLICGKKEHTHDKQPSGEPTNNQVKNGVTTANGCYKATGTKNGSSYKNKKWTYVCTKSEHSHTDNCYGDKTVQECVKDEHQHTDACYKITPAHGDQVTGPIPEKTGYAFDGWYLDEACTQKAPLMLENIEGDVNLYAKWKAADVSYRIVYYTENANDNGYTFDSSDTATAKAGDKVSGKQKAIDGFAYNSSKSDKNVEVSADGSTVVKMYYSRNTYTFTFKDGSTTVYSFTAKWGSNISDKWTFTGSNGTKYPKTNTVTSWTPSGSKTYTQRITGLETMPKENITWTHTTSSNEKRTFNYYVESLGNGTKSFDGKKFDLYKSVEHDFNQVYYADDFLELDGYDRYKYTKQSSATGTETTGTQTSGSWTTTKVTNFYYKLKEYKITKISDGVSTDKSYKFGANISGESAAPQKPAGKEDYTFGGWYEDPDCAGSQYSFGTMPSSNIILYAKWIKPEKTVTIKFQNGEKEESITVAKGEKVSIPMPEREGYNFAGWYTAAEGGEEYDINAPITEDVTIYAHWTKKSKVAYTVRYIVKGDESKTIHDPETLQGSVGKRVSAKAVPATGEYEGYYVDQDSKTIVLDQDASKNVITFEYEQCSDFQYKVVFKCGDEVVKELDPVTVETNTARVIVSNKDIPKGYSLVGNNYQNVRLSSALTEVVFDLQAKNYTITYDMGVGGAAWAGDAGCSHPATYTVNTLEKGDITIDGLQASGYAFMGWDFTAKNVDGSAPQVDSHNPANPVIGKETRGNLVFTGRWAKISAEDVEKTYDGQPITISPAVVSGIGGVDVSGYDSIRYKTEGGQWSTEIPEFTDAGTYTVQFQAQSKAGYRTLNGSATVTINKRNVTLTSATDSKVFDEKPLKNDKITVGGEGFAQGEGATYNVTGSQTENGSSKNTFTYELNKGTKAGNYNISTVEGTLTVDPYGTVTVTVKENSGEYAYDGTVKSVNGYEVVSISDPRYTTEDFTFSGTAQASGTDVGTYDMNISADNFTNNNDNFIVRFVVQDGSLVIKPVSAKITITAASESKTYDGTALTNDGYTYTKNVLVDGDVLTAVVEGTITNAGTAANKVTSYKVMRGETNVTGNYTFAPSEDGQLAVNKRSVILTSGSAERVYNGQELSNNEVKVTGDGFLSGEGATYNVTGKRLNVGTVDNSFEYTLNEGTKAANYDITKVYGKLTVLPPDTPITITAKSASKTYDGTPLTEAGFDYTDGILANGDVLTAVVNGTITNVGTVKNKVTSYKVMRGNEDVTGNYTFADTVDGELAVTKRTVTLTSATDSKTYDGTPLTNKNVTAGGDGFAEGEGASYDVTGTQTRAGSSSNTFTYELNKGTKADNYNISVVEGTLTVAKKGQVVVTITGKSGSFPYNGEAQSVSGYEVSISDPLYTIEDFEGPAQDSAKATATRTLMGTTEMELYKSDFSNKNDDFSNVTFNVIPGSVTITKNETPIVITASSDSKTYDGTPLTAEYTFTENVLAAGDELVVEMSGSQKDVGESANTVASYSVMRGDRDVTDYYTFGDSVDGKLTVTKRSVTLVSAGGSKVYDGTPLTNSSVTVDADTEGFAKGEGFKANVTGSQTTVGTSNNTFTYTLNAGTDADNYVISTRFGNLEVTKITTPITVTAADDSKTYDSKALENNGFTYTEGVLLNGDVLTAVVTGSQTNAGSSANVVTSVSIKRGETDVTGCYTIAPSVNGTLTVSPRKVTIASASASKTYDGTALTKDEIIVTGDEFVEAEGIINKLLKRGEGFTAEVTGTRTLAGTSKNTFTYELKEGTLAQNYEITKVEGDLTVNRISAPITITAASDSKKYDGSALTKNDYTFTEGVLLGGDTLTATVEGTITNAGTASNEVKSYKVENKAGQDVTGCYTFGDSVNGTLTVTQRNVTLTSATANKEYDGTPLENHEITVGGDGFIKGEGYTANVTGSQTDVGGEQYNNEFTYELNEGTLAKNYNIQTVFGTLTVADVGEVVVTITGKSKEVDYNGSEQSVSGYTVEISNNKYKESDFTKPAQDSEEATASGTAPDTYAMDLKVADFHNNNTNFGNVRFVVIPGQLVIKKIEKPITITASSAEKMYDGSALTKNEFTYTEGVLANGDVLTAVVEGSITDYGTAANTVTSYKVKHGNTDVTEYYTFTDSVPGTLSIAKRSITLTSATEEKDYDGTPLENKVLSEEGDGFVDGEGYTAVVTGTITNAGTAVNAFTYALKDNTKAINYDITKVEGTLTVNQADNVLVHIRGNNNGDGVAYDGNEKTVSGYTWTATVNTKEKVIFTENDFTFNGSDSVNATDAGTYPMGLTEDMFADSSNGNFKSVTFDVVDGYLKINPVSTPIIVKASSDSKMYDGTALTAGYTYTQNVLLSGDELVATVDGSITDVGTADNVVTGVKVMRGSKDVTSSYTFGKHENGKLEITKRNVILTSATDNKDYDGKALTNSDVAVTGDGFAEGEGATYNVTGTITDVGETDNTFTYELNDGTLDGNYTISTVTGKLSINPITAELVIKAGSAGKTYDGKALTCSSFTYTENVLKNGDRLEVTTTGSQTDFGTSANVISEYKVMRGNTDVTDNYSNISTEDGTLSISKRIVTLESATDSKTYDGKALTNDKITVGGDGFAEGQGADYDVTGTITEAGSVPNAFTYELKGGATADNYSISVKYGTLTVSDDPNEVIITITGKTDTVTYDGDKHVVNGYDVSVSNEKFNKDDIEFSGNAHAEGVNVGTYTMGLKVSDFTNKSKNFKNVTFVVNDGSLVVNPIATEIVITAASDHKTYDGQPLTNNDFTYTRNVLVNGDVLTAVVEGTVTDAGTAANRVTSYKVKHGENDVTGNYTFGTPVDGQLEVTKRTVTLTSATDSKTYDGTALTNENVDVTGDGFAEGEGASFNVTGTVTNAGPAVDNEFTYTLNEGTKASNYNISKKVGTLQVTPLTDKITVTITENSGEEIYDGTEKTVTGYTAEYSDPLYTAADYTFNGNAVVKGTNVGEYNMGLASNDFANTNSNFSDVEFVIVDGKLKINPITTPIVIKANGSTKMYDGTALTEAGYTFTEDVLADGDVLTAVTSGSITNAGKTDNVISSYIVKNAKGVDVTDCYTFGDTQNGTLEVTKRNITLKSGSAAKKYDGRALTNGEVTVGGDGFAEGEGATYNVTGSQTEVGGEEHNNVFDYTLNNGTNSNNYIVKKEYGTLTVTKGNGIIVTITEHSGEFDYNGTERTVSGYDVEISDPAAYKTSDFTFDGNAVVKATDAGTYDMDLKASDFTNNNDSFEEGGVTFVIVDGQLKIKPVDTKVTVTIKGTKKDVAYNGTVQEVNGFSFESDNELFTRSKMDFTGSDHAEGLVAGNYPMGLKTTDFSSKDNVNFTNVEFIVEDGGINIAQSDRKIVINANSDTKKYDGTALINNGWTYDNSTDSLFEGDRAVVEVTGSQTDAGKSDNVPNVKIMNGTTDVTSSYKAVTGKKGELEVTKRDVILTSATASKTYDGTPLTDHNVTVGGDGFATGESAVYSVTGTVTNAGAAVDNEFTYQLSGAKADNYNIKTVFGKLTVNKVTTPIIVTADSDSKTYDGTPLTDNGFTYTENVLASGDVLTAVVEGTITDAGQTANEVKSYRVTRGTEDVTNNYTFGTPVDGTLTISKRPVTLTSKTDSKTYDGTALTNSNVEISGMGFVTGEGVTCDVTGSQTNAGTSKNEFTYTFNTGTTAGNYEVTKVEGDLIVSKRGEVIVTITGTKADREYNGTKQSVNGYEVSISNPLYTTACFEGPAQNDEKATAGRTDVGKTSMTLAPADFTNINENFENVVFNVDPGYINITAVATPIVVKAKDASKKYDGQALTQGEWEVVSGSAKGSDTIAVTTNGTITDAGNTVNSVSSVKVMRGDTDVSQFYTFGTNQSGTLTVSPRELTLTSATDSKTYDGKALTNSDVAVTGDGFADGEGATYDVTGSQTDMGTSDNEFTYTLNSGTKAGNYIINKVEGTLTVDAVTDKVTVTITEHGGEYTYDGTLKTAEGYDFASSDNLYTADNVSFAGNASVSGTDVGTYEMMLQPENFTNTSANFTDVEFVIEDGVLKINPINTEIEIKAASANKVYDGTALTNSGYTVTEGVLVNGDTVVPVIRGTQTNAGESANAVTSYKIMNGDKDVTGNYSNVKKTPGTLKVTKRNIELTSGSDGKPYDKTPLRNTEVTVTGGDGFAANEGFTYSAFPEITKVGKIDNEFTVAANDGTNLDNYNITKKYGTLEIVKKGSIVVTITGHNNGNGVTYDGTEKNVSGYDVDIEGSNAYTEDDFTFSGSKTVNGTNAGTYPMGLKAADFANNDDEAFDVTFVVNDGYLKINPVTEAIEVVITEHSGAYDYDGAEKTVSGYDIAIPKGSLYKAADFSKPAQDSAKATAKGTYAGTYDLNLKAADFANTNPNFTGVTFRIEQGALLIRPVESNVVVKAGNKEDIYNGTPLTNSRYTVEGDLIEGDIIDGVVIEGTQTDAGESANVVKSFKVMRNGVDVTESYSGISTANGKLKVTARPVTLTSATDSKTYDGTPLINKNVKIEGLGFVSGQGANFNVTGSQLDKGTSDNTFTYTLNSGTKADNYDITVVTGKLTVKKVDDPITVTAGSNHKTYDGTALTDRSFTVTEGILAAGDTVTAVVEGTITDAGTAANQVTSYKVMRGDTDVTDNYTFADSVDGVLEVYKRNVELASATDSKSYDGKPLVNHQVTVGGDKFAPGEGATYDVTGSQTEVGGSEGNNVFEYTLDEGTKAANYVITKIPGTLTVAASDKEVVVTITEHSGRYTYDGTEKTVKGYDVQTSNPLYTENDFTFDGNATVKRTNAGTSEMKLTPEDFTNTSERFTNVTFKIVDGSLVIDKKKINIQIITDSADKTYDGTALTAAGSTITGEPAAAGQEITVTTKGSQKNAGESANKVDTIKVMAGDNDVTANYEINADVTEGKLTVDKRKVTLESAGDTKVYDGKVLTKNDVTGGEDFVEGEVSNIRATGKIKDYVEGGVKNEIEFDTADTFNKDNYIIKTVENYLTIKPREVVLTSESANRPYDGTPLTKPEVTATGGEGYEKTPFVEGEVTGVEATGKATYFSEGEVVNKIVIHWADGVNKDNYIITKNEGILQINKKSDKVIRIIADSLTKMYDGTKLSAEDANGAGYTFTEGILSEGDVLQVVLEGGIKNVGEAENTVKSFRVMRDGVDVTSNYDFEAPVNGTLTVTPRHITVTSASASKVYDGKVLTANSVSITGDGMAENEYLLPLFGEGQLGVGSKENTFNCKVVDRYDAEQLGLLGLDDSVKALEASMDRNYEITKIYGTLTVKAAAGGAVDNGNGGGTAFNNNALVLTNGYDLTVIGNADTPLANSLLDAHCCILHLILMLLALIMLAWYTHDMKARQRRIFELEEELYAEE